MYRLKTVLVTLSALLLLAGSALGAPTAGEKAADQAVVECVDTEEATCASAPEPLEQDELTELAQRDEQPGDEVTGGALSNEHLTYIVIAMAAAVIVLIAVN